MLQRTKHKAFIFESVLNMLGQRHAGKFEYVLLATKVSTGKNKTIGAISHHLNVLITQSTKLCFTET